MLDSGASLGCRAGHLDYVVEQEAAGVCDVPALRQEGGMVSKSEIWQTPSPAWRSPKVEARGSGVLTPSEEKCLLGALEKISGYAVDKQLTLAQVYDYLRTSMVHAASEKFGYGEKKRVASTLAIHRNTVSRIKKRAS